jgi:8-oxo-dGTP pyrophosphatase MutT (NUDIX family)
VFVWRHGQNGREWLVLHRSIFGRDFEGDWAWSSPGGALEHAEDPDRAACRELLEETGLDLACKRIDREAGPALVYVAEAPAHAEVRLSPEHDRYEWLSTEQAAARCRPTWVGALFEELA